VATRGDQTTNKQTTSRRFDLTLFDRLIVRRDKATRPSGCSRLIWPNPNHTEEPMAQAINIVLPSAVISTIARQSAIKAIKERLRAQGVKLSHVSARAGR
jgi:hypothetical protein